MSDRSNRAHKSRFEFLERREMLSSMAAAGFRTPGGQTVVTDDFGNTFAQAALLSFSTTGAASQSGKIEARGDVDVFKFTATVTGKLTIKESATAGSRLDSYVYAYDAQQRLLGKNDDSGRSLNSQLVINVTAGQTYYIKAAAFGRSTGTYVLQLATTGTTTPTDDFGNTIAQAKQVSLSTAGSATRAGKIEQAGDVDMFKIVATATGTMTIRQSASSGSQLNCKLSVYDSSGALLAENDDNGSSTNSQVQISVVAGTTYYLAAAGSDTSTGAYNVQIATAAAVTDDFGNTIADAKQVNVSSAGSATQAGKIEQAGDVDVFKVVATVTGTMTVRLSAASGSQLDCKLTVYDASGTLLAENDDNGSSTNSQLQISVVAGTTYYVAAAGEDSTTDVYTVSLSTAATTTPSESGFQITATITGMTSAAQTIIEQAIAIWENVITADVPDVTYHGRVVDDIEIAISGITIDGSGNILGQSAVTAIRDDSCLPYMSYIQLDTADVADMLSDGSLLGVMTHEIAHSLGFGVIWTDLGLLTGSRTRNPGFTGANAVAAYNSIFGTSATAVPVEADGGSGTRLSHWDETVFDTNGT